MLVRPPALEVLSLRTYHDSVLRTKAGNLEIVSPLTIGSLVCTDFDALQKLSLSGGPLLEIGNSMHAEAFEGDPY